MRFNSHLSGFNFNYSLFIACSQKRQVIVIILPNQHRDIQPVGAPGFAHAAMYAGNTVDIRAVITDTFSGKTARYLASYRGSDPIIAFCYKERASRELALSYGVYSYFKEELVQNERTYFTTLLQNLLKREIINPDDMLCYMSGPKSGNYGTTFLEVNTAKTLLEEIDKYTLQ